MNTLKQLSNYRATVILVSALTMSACGGSGSDDEPAAENRSPVASAGPDQTVIELTSVTLDAGGSSDPDGNALTYSWTQQSGAAVTLTGATSAMPTFDAPDLAPGTTDVLVFRVTASDGALSTTDDVSISVQEPLLVVNVAGTVRYEWANANANCRGLNLGSPEPRAMRGVTVQILDDASGNVLDSTVSALDGSYSFTNIDANTSVRIRARAELKNSGPAIWDVEVRDNVDTSANPPPITQRPLYVVDFPAFDSGTNNIAGADFTAVTGWDTGSNSYAGARQSAPFAILDSIMSAMSMVATYDTNVNFPALDVYWSVNNMIASPRDEDAGELPTSFYTQSGLYLLGDADSDTEEFDDHVSIHEWGHYFEDNFSRSDNFGGNHFIGDPLDPRVAFGEGFASGLAAIALQDPIYCDTSAPMLTGGFGIDWEIGNSFLQSDLQGWFNEWTVGTLIYDLWDSGVDGSDNSSIGFGPIYETMVGPQRVTPEFTTMFSFAAGLRPMLSGPDLAFANSQFNRINVDTPATVSESQWGAGQTTAPTNGTYPNGDDIIPPYTNLQVGAAPVNVCVNNDYYGRWAEGEIENKFGMNKHFWFETTGSAGYTITATANPALTVTTGSGDAAPRDDSDPDMFLHRAATWFPFASSTDDGDGTEVFTTPNLTAGTYMLLLQEWRHVDETRAATFPTQVCFDVSISSP